MLAVLQASISSVPAGAVTFLPSTVSVTNWGLSAMDVNARLYLLQTCLVRRAVLDLLNLQRVSLRMRSHQ